MCTWDYFPWPGTKGFSTACLVLLVPFTLASRKHYTVDVFTSLYVVPIMYELMKVKFPDKDTTMEMEQNYGLKFLQDRVDPLTYNVIIRKQTFGIHLDQLPRDFNVRQTFSSLDHKVNSGTDSYETLTTASPSPPRSLTARGVNSAELGV